LFKDLTQTVTHNLFSLPWTNSFNKLRLLFYTFFVLSCLVDLLHKNNRFLYNVFKCYVIFVSICNTVNCHVTISTSKCPLNIRAYVSKTCMLVQRISCLLFQTNFELLIKVQWLQNVIYKNEFSETCTCKSIHRDPSVTRY